MNDFIKQEDSDVLEAFKESSLSFDEIMDNRRKWVNYLKSPEAKKTVGRLEDKDGSRCCLGHGCHILDIPRSENYGYFEGCSSVAPISFMVKVGLMDDTGWFGTWTENGFSTTKNDKYGLSVNSLAELNDETSLTSQEIGELIEKMIEGGEDTPFMSKEDYKKIKGL